MGKTINSEALRRYSEITPKPIQGKPLDVPGIQPVDGPIVFVCRLSHEAVGTGRGCNRVRVETCDPEWLAGWQNRKPGLRYMKYTEASRCFRLCLFVRHCRQRDDDGLPESRRFRGLVAKPDAEQVKKKESAPAGDGLARFRYVNEMKVATVENDP